MYVYIQTNTYHGTLTVYKLILTGAFLVYELRICIKRQVPNKINSLWKYGQIILIAMFMTKSKLNTIYKNIYLFNLIVFLWCTVAKMFTFITFKYMSIN